ncbi:MAG: hypothetical protein IJI26_12145, partial [Clostridia bacterium]|nr:hypothetical protein [Clostridia bacterium]
IDHVDAAREGRGAQHERRRKRQYPNAHATALLLKKYSASRPRVQGKILVYSCITMDKSPK